MAKKTTTSGKINIVPLFEEFPCIKVTQANQSLFIFASSAKRLYDLVQVNRRVESKSEGYQRVLSELRANQVATFIDGGNMIPLSLLVCFDEATYDETSKTISVPRRPDAGWVIDGQHRLEGAHRAKTDIAFPVVALIDPRIETQIDLFVKINKEHKGVPSSLYLELLSQLPGTITPKRAAQQRATDIADKLRTDPESPFFGRIVSTTNPQPGQLSLTNFVRKVEPLVSDKVGALGALMLPKVVAATRPAVIANFYRALAQVFPEYFEKDSIFFKTLGFGAMMGFFPDFFITTRTESNGHFRVSDAVSMLKRIEGFDFSLWALRGTGSKAETVAREELRKRFHECLSSTSEGDAGPMQV